VIRTLAARKIRKRPLVNPTDAFDVVDSRSLEDPDQLQDKENRLKYPAVNVNPASEQISLPLRGITKLNAPLSNDAKSSLQVLAVREYLPSSLAPATP
jgi:hypothetical protein